MTLDETIRVIPHRHDSAAYSLAIDAALFEEMKKNPSQPILRTYQFARPAVILGYRQKSRLNQDELNGTDVTMRESGGGHLLFSPSDINISFIAPRSYFNSTNIIKNYQQINRIIVEALRAAGYAAELGRTSIRLHSPDGKIIAGAAQRRSDACILHQATILVEPYKDLTFDLLGAREDEIRLWQERVIALKETGINNHWAIPTHLINSIPGDHIIKTLTTKEELAAETHLKEKFNNPKFIHTGTNEADLCLVAEYSKDNQ